MIEQVNQYEESCAGKVVSWHAGSISVEGCAEKHSSIR